ncbi:MAG: DUF2794 domain-containing protein [Methyloligellaceae bacterium]
MSEIEPIPFVPAGSYPGLSGKHEYKGSKNKKLLPITFNRDELFQILNIYGRNVSLGDWRDYAIDMLRDRAVFSIFRRASETPIYRIEKNPKLARKQGMYSVITPTGLILKRGHDLGKVLRVIDRKIKLVEY